MKFEIPPIHKEAQTHNIGVFAFVGVNTKKEDCCRSNAIA